MYVVPTCCEKRAFGFTSATETLNQYAPSVPAWFLRCAYRSWRPSNFEILKLRIFVTVELLNTL